MCSRLSDQKSGWERDDSIRRQAKTQDFKPRLANTEDIVKMLTLKILTISTSLAKLVTIRKIQKGAEQSSVLYSTWDY
jgi:hypothetical protein